jgi:uridine kinase
MIKIFCKNTGTFGEFNEGTALLEIAEAFEFDKPYPILAAKVNNVTEGLRFRVYHNLDVEFLDYRTYSGRNFYCRSLCFLLYEAVHNLFPESRLSTDISGEAPLVSYMLSETEELVPTGRTWENGYAGAGVIL